MDRPRTNAFTLLEICLAILVALLILGAAVPAISGVLKQRKAEESFAAFDRLVQEARRRSVEERRPWVLEWSKEGVTARPDGAAPDANKAAGNAQDNEEEEAPVPFATLEGDGLALELKAALIKNPPPLWTFWPTGVCEPAVVTFEGEGLRWVASYDALTARPAVTYEDR